VGENGRTSKEGLRALRRTCVRALFGVSVPLCVAGAIALAGPGSAYAGSLPKGALSQLSSPANCVGEEEEKIAECDTKVHNGLSLAYQVQVSPDGRNAYSVAIGGGLTEYGRNPATGALSVIGCITSSTNPCASTNATDNVSILGQPTSLAISPNGQNVYVTAQTHNAVVELEREPLTGLLTIMGEGKACVSGESGECEVSDAKGLSVPYGVAISPDEKSVYVTSVQGEDMAELERSTTTGLLTPISGHECIGAPDTGCPEESAVGLFEPIGVTVSPDGKNVYVAAGASGERGDVAEFSRATNGVLKQLSGEDACVSSKITECKAINVLQGSEDLVVSAGGQNVYATSFDNSAVVELERESSTGALTQLGGNNHCISKEAIVGCTQVKGIGGTRGVAISPNGANVYVGSTSENSVAAFSRDEGSGALTQLEEPHECVSSGSGGEQCGSHTLVGLVGTRRLTVSRPGRPRGRGAGARGNTVGLRSDAQRRRRSRRHQGHGQGQRLRRRSKGLLRRQGSERRLHRIGHRTHCEEPGRQEGRGRRDREDLRRHLAHLFRR
jgi:DNA-binding beta-propeller fold protein YncE